MDLAWLRLGAAESLQVNGCLGLPERECWALVTFCASRLPSAFAAWGSAFSASAEPAEVRCFLGATVFHPAKMSPTGTELESFMSNTMRFLSMSLLSVSKTLALM